MPGTRAGIVSTPDEADLEESHGSEEEGRKGWSRRGRRGQGSADNPYVQRLIEDEELRDNLRSAFESAQKAYGRMSNGKGPAKALMDDKKMQRELKEAAESLREAADALRGRRRRSSVAGSAS